MSDRTIYPTRTCFDDAIEYLEYWVRQDPSLAFGTARRLVHGVIVLPAPQPDAGRRVAHAWLEDDDTDTVWASGVLHGDRVYYQVAKTEYYAHLQIDPLTVTRYTCREVLAENRRSGHYGPWRADLRRLVRAGASRDDPETPS